jgi:pectin methylesterase-like acyl-CoA thioesterase
VNGKLDIESRYCMERGVSGLYTYQIFTHPASYPATGIGEGRFCIEGRSVMDWLSVDADRNMLMCSDSDDRAIFTNCRFDGFQDTLLVNGKRQYFDHCRIDGAVDFIFGASTCFFQDCEIHAVRRGYLTAASTPQHAAFGYVFSHCKIIGDGIKPGSLFLGRPWQPYAAVAYLNCYMDKCISPAGWSDWRDPAKEKTARYSEYHNSGPGAVTTRRVAWSHQLSDSEASSYTVHNVLGDSDAWSPSFSSVSLAQP